MSITLTSDEHWAAICEYLIRRRVSACLSNLKEGQVGPLTFSDITTIKDNGFQVDPYRGPSDDP